VSPLTQRENAIIRAGAVFLMADNLAGVQVHAARALGLVGAMQDASAALIKGTALMPPRRPMAAPSATPGPPAEPEHDE